MKRYSAYKQTEYDWLSEVPEHWIEKPIRAITKLSDKRNENRTDLELLSVYREYGVIKKSSRDDNHNVESEDVSNYKYVKPGNLVINKMKAWQGSLGISNYEGIVSPAYIVCEITEQVYSPYLNVLLRSNPFKTFYNRISYGVRVGQWDMNYEDFKTLHIYLPPLDEQKAIADFLDKKTEQIDRFISLQKEAISLLKELRQAEITKAVTKGLDENAEMKDSGVESVGSIPKGWNTIKLKYSTYIRARLGWKGLKADEYVESGYTFLSAFNIINDKLVLDNVNYINKFRYDESPEIKLTENDILLVKDGAGIGKCAIVETLNCEATVNGSLAVITVTHALFPKYLYYYFISKIFQEYIDKIKDGMGVPHLFQSDLKEISISYSSLSDQKRIVDYLDKKCAEIDSAIQNKEALIEKVTEYKIRLISDAVTGKIDVRGEDIKPRV